MKTAEEIKKGDKVLYCDDDGFGVETVLQILGDYIVTDRTIKLKQFDKWHIMNDYKLTGEGVKKNMTTAEEADKRDKALVFVEHIENHLEKNNIKGKVCCKICGKNIDHIFEEEGVKKYEV